MALVDTSYRFAEGWGRGEGEDVRGRGGVDPDPGGYEPFWSDPVPDDWEWIRIPIMVLTNGLF
jgi:hypothetical protein